MSSHGKRVPLRIRLHDGMTYWRAIDASQLGNTDDLRRLVCNVGGLDIGRITLDVPTRNQGGKWAGYILLDRNPIGTVHVAYEGETFRDDDPVDFLHQPL